MIKCVPCFGTCTEVPLGLQGYRWGILVTVTRREFCESKSSGEFGSPSAHGLIISHRTPDPNDAWGTTRGIAARTQKDWSCNINRLPVHSIPFHFTNRFRGFVITRKTTNPW